VAAFPVEGWRASAAVVVSQSDGVVAGEVHASVGERDAAWQHVLAALSLDFDGDGFVGVGERDPVIAGIQRRYGFLRPVCNFTPYEAAVARVLGQRISIAQQRRIRAAMAGDLGDVLEIDGMAFSAFPRPQALLEVQSYPGVSAEKLRRLHAVCTAALDGSLNRERLRSVPLAKATAQLRRIHGVGEWTAQGIVLRGAGVVDEIPDDDVTKQAVQRAYRLDRPPTQAEVEHRAQAWRPYRMWAIVLLHVWLRNEGGGIDRRALPQ